MKNFFLAFTLLFLSAGHATESKKAMPIAAVNMVLDIETQHPDQNLSSECPELSCCCWTQLLATVCCTFPCKCIREEFQDCTRRTERQVRQPLAQPPVELFKKLKDTKDTQQAQ